RLQPGGALGVVDPRVVVESARMSHMQQLHLRTLSHVRSELRTKGDWPGVVRLRRGWAAAQARPWNDQTVELASLRLERGGDRFLGACVQWLGERGVRRVLSRAMPDDQSSPWRRAGFENHLEFVVFEKDLRMPPSPPLHRVTVDSSPDAAALAVIDDRAFDPVWRIGQAGLADAMAATPNSVVLVVEVAGVTVGFAIVGEMAGSPTSSVSPCTPTTPGVASAVPSSGPPSTGPVATGLAPWSSTRNPRTRPQHVSTKTRASSGSEPDSVSWR